MSPDPKPWTGKPGTNPSRGRGNTGSLLPLSCLTGTLLVYIYIIKTKVQKVVILSCFKIMYEVIYLIYNKHLLIIYNTN